LLFERLDLVAQGIETEARLLEPPGLVLGSGTIEIGALAGPLMQLAHARGEDVRLPGRGKELAHLRNGVFRMVADQIMLLELGLKR